jgi:predicted DNA repair protein MutK
MAKNPSSRVRHTGMRIVRSMPAVFRVISVVGTVAMLWVGGHLVLANLGEVGVAFTLDLLHGVEHLLEAAGGAVVWVGETAVSAIAGLLVGLVIVGVITAVRRVRDGGPHAAGRAH